MKVNKYLLENPDKSAYTVKYKRHAYLCNFLECAKIFGNMEIKKISYEKEFDNSICYGIPVLHLI